MLLPCARLCLRISDERQVALQTWSFKDSHRVRGDGCSVCTVTGWGREAWMGVVPRWRITNLSPGIVKSSRDHFRRASPVAGCRVNWSRDAQGDLCDR